MKKETRGRKKKSDDEKLQTYTIRLSKNLIDALPPKKRGQYIRDAIAAQIAQQENHCMN